MINMRTLAVRSIRSNPTRFVATVLAVVVSTGFLGGTLVLRDSLSAALEAATRSQLEGVDVAVSNQGSLISAPPAAAPADPNDPTGTAPAAGGPAPSAGGRRQELSSGAESDPISGGRPRQLGVNQNVPASVLPAVRQAEGVQDASGVLSGFLSVLDGHGGSVAENVAGSVWIPVPDLTVYRVVEGRAPQAPGEVLLAVSALVWLTVLGGYLRYVLSDRPALVRDLTASLRVER